MSSQSHHSPGHPPTRVGEAPYFSLDLHRRADTDVVELLLTGDVDDATVGHLDDSLDWVVEHMPQQTLVVDLSDVTRLQACGVASLLRVTMRLRAVDRSLAVRGGTEPMHAALAAAGVPHADDAPDALPPRA